MSKSIVGTCIGLGCLLFMWQLLIQLFDIPIIVLPAPSDLIAQLVANWKPLMHHGLITTWIIVLGFFAGTIPAIAMAYLFTKFRRIEQFVYPIVVFVQGFPKIALAPLLLVWFGFADFPKVLLTSIVTFFPVIMDSTTGFRSIDPRQYHLSRSLGADWWQTFWYFEMPSATQNIFSGMKIAIVLAVTIVIVVEWLGSQNGLGFLVLRAMNESNLPLLFAILFVGSMIGVVLSASLSFVERIMSPRPGS